MINDILIMMGIMVAAVVPTAFIMIKIMKNGDLDSQIEYDLFRFEDGELILLRGMRSRRYKIENIWMVEFSKVLAAGRFSLGGYKGRFQVITRDGRKSRMIEFDGSVYYRHIVVRTNEEIIDKSIELLQEQLRESGIRCKTVRYSLKHR